MTHFSISRCRFLYAIAVVALLSSWAVTENVSSEPAERTKREFMELVVEDINDQQKIIQTAMDRSKKEGNGGALFVQIPSLIPFIDFDYWYIDRDLRWAPPIGSLLPSVKVPKGFVSDLASVPGIFWGKYPPTGRYAYAAVVHDYLYWSQAITREIADEILAIGMRDAGTDETTITAFKLAVNATGWKAWSNNQEAKARGEKRVLGVFPSDRLVSWKDWKAKSGVFKD